MFHELLTFTDGEQFEIIGICGIDFVDDRLVTGVCEHVHMGQFVCECTQQKEIPGIEEDLVKI